MSDSRADLETAVKDRFAALAERPAEEKQFPVGPDSARRLGYSALEIDSLPPSVTESFAGVGNPFSLAALCPGQVVLDLGCGAGMDSILAARRVGPTGRVIGIDMVEQMLVKARHNAEAMAVPNIDSRAGRADALPVSAASVDVVITNGVFNLCVDKPRVVAELFRVLRPGGRLQMADILLEPHVTPERARAHGLTECPEPSGSGRSWRCWRLLVSWTFGFMVGPATARQRAPRGHSCQRSSRERASR
jgi:SAM-dependent methyltransferase